MKYLKDKRWRTLNRINTTVHKWALVDEKNLEVKSSVQEEKEEKDKGGVGQLNWENSEGEK